MASRDSSVDNAPAGDTMVAAEPAVRSFAIRRSTGRGRRRRRITHPSAMVSLILLLAIVVIAVGAPIFTNHSPNEVVVTDRLQPPWSTSDSGFHPLGTDGLGRDIWSQIAYGSRVSLLVALVAVVAGAVLGVVLGVIAGYYGGRIDSLLMRLVDIQLSIPLVVLAIAILAVLGAGVFNLVLALSLTGWTEFARVARAQVLSLREREYVDAARVAGGTGAWILARHMVPNIVPSLSVLVTLEVGHRILTQASLSYLGLGVPPETADWGRMIASGQQYIFNAWWIPVLPGIAICLTVLSLNMLGDWVRDLTDPQFRHRR